MTHVRTSPLQLQIKEQVSTPVLDHPAVAHNEGLTKQLDHQNTIPAVRQKRGPGRPPRHKESTTSPPKTVRSKRGRPKGKQNKGMVSRQILKDQNSLKAMKNTLLFASLKNKILPSSETQQNHFAFADRHHSNQFTPMPYPDVPSLPDGVLADVRQVHLHPDIFKDILRLQEYIDPIVSQRPYQVDAARYVKQQTLMRDQKRQADLAKQNAKQNAKQQQRIELLHNSKRLGHIPQSRQPTKQRAIHTPGVRPDFQRGRISSAGTDVPGARCVIPDTDTRKKRKGVGLRTKAQCTSQDRDTSLARILPASQIYSAPTAAISYPIGSPASDVGQSHSRLLSPAEMYGMHTVKLKARIPISQTHGSQSYPTPSQGLEECQSWIGSVSGYDDSGVNLGSYPDYMEMEENCTQLNPLSHAATGRHTDSLGAGLGDQVPLTPKRRFVDIREGLSSTEENRIGQPRVHIELFAPGRSEVNTIDSQITRQTWSNRRSHRVLYQNTSHMMGPQHTAMSTAPSIKAHTNQSALQLSHSVPLSGSRFAFGDECSEASDSDYSSEDSSDTDQAESAGAPSYPKSHAHTLIAPLLQHQQSVGESQERDDFEEAWRLPHYHRKRRKVGHSGRVAGDRVGETLKYSHASNLQGTSDLSLFHQRASVGGLGNPGALPRIRSHSHIPTTTAKGHTPLKLSSVAPLPPLPPLPLRSSSLPPDTLSAQFHSGSRLQLSPQDNHQRLVSNSCVGGSSTHAGSSTENAAQNSTSELGLSELNPLTVHAAPISTHTLNDTPFGHNYQSLVVLSGDAFPSLQPATHTELHHLSPLPDFYGLAPHEQSTLESMSTVASLEHPVSNTLASIGDMQDGITAATTLTSMHYKPIASQSGETISSESS
ncbi:hypothetical protein SARC_09618 [Sphaeroforma arctica JP610]|uniref:Uncharacterized protein n=1 Tax=Sphaeroforma arctica JP610 TaxID=667725 RepID=A0A0L0FN67_9EUKA|nr:hypothetical protein SARC_09618 [Sphaeroforma arctica JP610]KNC77936.1 hypothetical protein SARC_09618 [Sphaeroforma arctica JP610]|eukprot:XP_014151838.1 hypothetical protein SARC_09618 [Sphaeroforma arctica JP610]